jgi:hypothetical protein
LGKTRLSKKIPNVHQEVKRRYCIPEAGTEQQKGEEED